MHDLAVTMQNRALGQILILRGFFTNPDPIIIPRKKSQEGSNLTQGEPHGEFMGFEFWMTFLVLEKNQPQRNS